MWLVDIIIFLLEIFHNTVHSAKSFWCQCLVYNSFDDIPYTLLCDDSSLVAYTSKQACFHDNTVIQWTTAMPESWLRLPSIIQLSAELYILFGTSI